MRRLPFPPGRALISLQYTYHPHISFSHMYIMIYICDNTVWEDSPFNLVQSSFLWVPYHQVWYILCILIAFWGMLASHTYTYTHKHARSLSLVQCQCHQVWWILCVVIAFQGITASHKHTHTHTHTHAHSCRCNVKRCIGYFKLQVNFQNRAIHYGALLRKMTYTDKTCYISSSTCIKTWYKVAKMYSMSVWHDSFICVTWLIHMCDMPNAYVW